MSQHDRNRARDLWHCYHYLTEVFDRGRCTGPMRDGSITPRDFRELGIVNQHARRVREVIASFGVSASDLKTLDNEIYQCRFEDHEREALACGLLHPIVRIVYPNGYHNDAHPDLSFLPPPSPREFDLR